MTREEYEAEIKAIDSDIDTALANRAAAQNWLTRLHAEKRALKLQYMYERQAVQHRMDRD